MSMFTCKTDCNGSASGCDSRHLNSQSGIGYVGVLALLAILSTLAMAFVHQVGTQVTANHARLQHMQSDYLAQSAANHALWRLLNEPGFAPAPDQYAMHAMAGGRYGYKVRKPGIATMATIATVGARQDAATQQSYVPYIIPSNIITAYGRAADPLPDYRRLVGAGMSDPADTLTVGSTAAYWMDLEGCPLRKEMVLAAINDVNDITLAVWDGTTWGNATTLSLDGDRNYKCFDIAYESQSGRALAVGRYDASTAAHFNIWDGTAWVHPASQPAFNIAGGAIRTVTMAACPGNNHILIATISWNNVLELFYWDGAIFTSLGSTESSMESDDFGAAQIAYERQSGDALLIWSARGNVRYRIWNGVTLGPETIVSQFTDDVFFLRAAPDPSSDHVVVAGVDKFYDITVALWDGESWVDGREVAISAADNSLPVVDVAWEAAGEDALVAWAPWGKTHVRFFSWTKGTAFSTGTVAQGPDLQQQPWLVELQPVSQSEKIVLLAMTNTEVLGYNLWTGDQFKGDPAIVLASDISVQNDRAFDLAEAEVPITGGSGTGGSANQPPVVDAGPDQTLVWPTYLIQFDGSVNDDGLPSPPGAVTTQWSKVSGPDPVGFGDISEIDTMAKVDGLGTYVFRLTADDGELSVYDDVTIILSNHCNADYTPTTKVSQFSTTAYDSDDTQSLSYIPEGMTFYKATAPTGGALISADTTDNAINMTNMAGNLLTRTSTATATTKGVALVTTGTFASHLATVDADLNTLTYVNMAGTSVAQLLLSSYGIGQAAGVGFIETTASGTYDGHIAVVDRVTESVYVIDQGGILKTIIDVNDGSDDAVQDVTHLPGSDKFIVPYLHEVRIYDFSGALLRQYDTASFGANDLESVIIDPNCNHVVADKGADVVMFLAAGSGSIGDTDPPTPNPMTWAKPPATVDSTSITMTATSASDASGVQYYFECTSAGCHDSDWQTAATYVDSGLSSGTSYVYRVKARDTSDGQNETGWSIEAKAATASNAMYVHDIAMGYRTVSRQYYGQATVWIKAAGGSDISGAVVSGNWSGSVSATSLGTTGSDGEVMLESPRVKNGGTFTFTVTSVVKTGYTYTPGMNVETWDSITAP